MKKQKYDLMSDIIVQQKKSYIQLMTPVPNGKTARLTSFGGYDPADNSGSIIALQWGSADTWITIRAGGSGFFDCLFGAGKDFIGDGAKCFRIVRQNKSSNDKPMIAWMGALIID